MVTLYRTARPPVSYKARVWSFATLFSTLCFILKIGGPILICFFYVDYTPSDSIDLELPSVVPGEILYFVASNAENFEYIYPPDYSSEIGISPTSIKTTPVYNGNKLKYWTVKLSIIDPNATSINSISVLFNYTVKLRKWATNTVQAIGSYTQNFPGGVNSVACSGDLILEQNEIIDFRGSFEQTNLDHYTFKSFLEVLEKEDNLSTLFYPEWDEPIIKYGYWPYFEIELRIRVREVEIFHSIPLVSSIESVLILYLSTYLLTSIILNNLVGFVFRKGIIKSWAIPLYQPADKRRGRTN